MQNTARKGTLRSISLITGGHLNFQLFIERQVDPAKLSVCMKTLSGDDIVVVPMQSVPESVTPISHKRLISTRMQKRVLGWEKLDLYVPIPGEHITSAVLEYNKKPVPGLATDLSLDVLLPTTKDEFREHFSFVNKRHKSAEVVRFMSHQILTNFLNDPSAVPAEDIGYIVNALVIYIYKLVELDETPSKNFEAIRSAVFEALETIPEHLKSVREDRAHLRVSALTALWHIYFNAGDIPRTVECLEHITRLYETKKNFAVSLGFNYCKSFLFYAALQYSSGDKKALRSWENVIDCYKASVALGTRKITWFAEMAQSHQAALCALMLSERVRADGLMDAEFLYNNTLPSLRVSSPEFKTRVQAMAATAFPAVSGSS